MKSFRFQSLFTNIRHLVVIFCLLVLNVSSVHSLQSPREARPSGSSVGGASALTLIWSDEFDGSSLNLSNWNYDVGGGGWGNHEQQYYTNGQNVNVAGGELTITAKKESSGSNCWYGPCQYTSSRITTKGKHEFQYGRIEAKIKFPSGQGLWPAFWMLGSNYPGTPWPNSGEIDISEHKNVDAYAYGAVHWYDDVNKHRADYSCPPSGGPLQSIDPSIYHTYDIEWDQKYIRWHVDGNTFCEILIQNSTGSTEEFHRPFFILLNLAIGGDFVGSPNDTTTFPANLVIDYVRVYSMPIISGNVGAPRLPLDYTDGTAKTATSGNDGSYSFPVSFNWSGTVTPVHYCYSFSPGSLSYSNLIADQPAQNYLSTRNNKCAVTAGVFRPVNGFIYLKNANTTGYADIEFNYGIGGDYPIAGDWNGDGIDSIGIYRCDKTGKGTFYLRDSNTIGYANVEFLFNPPDTLCGQPVAGDWNGDGIDTIGVYNSRTITFYLRDSNSEGPADYVFRLGIPGDIGIAGDWTNKGYDTVGVFRPSNGVIFLKNTNQTGYADIAINYGLGGDKPVTGDWDNNGTDTIGILRGNIFYLRNSNTIGNADMSFSLGIPGDMPIAGNWDGLP